MSFFSDNNNCNFTLSYVPNNIIHKETNSGVINLNNDLNTINRKYFKQELNDWLNSKSINANGILRENNEIVYNKDICKTIFNELLREVYNNQYKIEDINQFKEDFIYFMYNISKVE
jgi:hypothetical protein